MSKLFNYNLNEDQIKSMFQNHSLEYNEVAWQNFESILNEQSKSTLGKTNSSLNLLVNPFSLAITIFTLFVFAITPLLYNFINSDENQDILIVKASKNISAIKNNNKILKINSKYISNASILNDLLKSNQISNKPLINIIDSTKHNFISNFHKNERLKQSELSIIKNNIEEKLNIKSEQLLNSKSLLYSGQKLLDSALEVKSYEWENINTTITSNEEFIIPDL